MKSFMLLINRNGVVKKSNASIILILNLLIFLLTTCELSIIDPLLTAFDVRITRTCKSVTLVTTITAKAKATLTKIFSFINSKPIGTPTALNRAARNAIEINVNINHDVSIVLTLVKYLILTKRSTPNIAVV